eukprot:6415301-Pyramimonas_sp.AAC.1
MFRWLVFRASTPKDQIGVVVSCGDRRMGKGGSCDLGARAPLCCPSPGGSEWRGLCCAIAVFPGA